MFSKNFGLLKISTYARKSDYFLTDVSSIQQMGKKINHFSQAKAATAKFLWGSKNKL